jgi:hypothetical protein
MSDPPSIIITGRGDLFCNRQSRDTMTIQRDSSRTLSISAKQHIAQTHGSPLPPSTQAEKHSRAQFPQAGKRFQQRLHRLFGTNCLGRYLSPAMWSCQLRKIRTIADAYPRIQCGLILAQAIGTPFNSSRSVTTKKVFDRTVNLLRQEEIYYRITLDSVRHSSTAA